MGMAAWHKNSKICLVAFSLEYKHSLALLPTWSSPDYKGEFNYGKQYAFALHIFAITVTYSFLCPIITVGGLLFIGLKYLGKSDIFMKLCLGRDSDPYCTAAVVNGFCDGSGSVYSLL
jgi:hypothetical protein